MRWTTHSALAMSVAALMLAGCTVARQVKDDAGSYTRQTGEVLVDTGRQIGAAGKSAGQEIGDAARDAGKAVKESGRAARKVVSE